MRTRHGALTDWLTVSRGGRFSTVFDDSHGPISDARIFLSATTADPLNWSSTDIFSFLAKRTSWFTVYTSRKKRRRFITGKSLPRKLIYIARTQNNIPAFLFLLGHSFHLRMVIYSWPTEDMDNLFRNYSYLLFSKSTVVVVRDERRRMSEFPESDLPIRVGHKKVSNFRRDLLCQQMMMDGWLIRTERRSSPWAHKQLISMWIYTRIWHPMGKSRIRALAPTTRSSLWMKSGCKMSVNFSCPLGQSHRPIDRQFY